jgi:hypothetical protein
MPLAAWNATAGAVRNVSAITVNRSIARKTPISPLRSALR